MNTAPLLDEAYQQDLLIRQEALDPSRSFIVQAPAGSGKTALLMQRFLTLLCICSEPSQVIAITFTKKAAHEMRERILATLQNCTTEEVNLSSYQKKLCELGQRVLERDQALDWQLLKYPQQLRIQTIDSLNSDINTRLPLQSGLGAEVKIETDPQYLYRAAISETFFYLQSEQANLVERESFLRLLSQLDLNRLQSLLLQLLSKRDQWLPYLQTLDPGKEIRQALEQHRQFIINDLIEEVRKNFPKTAIREVLAILYFSQQELKSELCTLIAFCLTKEYLPTKQFWQHDTHFNEELILRFWKALAKLLLTKTFSWRKRVDATLGFTSLNQITDKYHLKIHRQFRQRHAELITLLMPYPHCQTSLTELLLVFDKQYQDQEWENLQALLIILKLLIKYLKHIFKVNTKIDFIENAHLALSALQSVNFNHAKNTENLAYTNSNVFAENIRHILIDEFQDTSHSQFRLLSALTKTWVPHDGKTLFIVGDPMQSIYRFRQAEVGIFIQLLYGTFGNITLQPLQLTTNFRSHAAIVDWNNHVFNKLFPLQHDIAKGGVSFAKSNVHPEKNKIVDDAAITITALEHSADSAGIAMVNTVKKLLEDYPHESIAILVRSRKHLVDIIPYLNQAQIAYQAHELDALISRPVILDLLSLTQALLQPFQRIAWLALLRAPYIGFSLSDLTLIANHDKHAAIWDLLNSEVVQNQLSLDGQCRLQRILPILGASLKLKHYSTFSQHLLTTWLALGGPAGYCDSAALEDAQQFFKLVDEIEQKAAGIELDNLQQALSQLYAYQANTNAYLHIMTIHSAKGLEFASVIIPHLEKKNPADKKMLLQWLEQTLEHNTQQSAALLLAPFSDPIERQDLLYDYIVRLNKIKADNEAKRLLYVATTRAVKRLILQFHIANEETKKSRIAPNSFLHSLWPFLKKDLQPPTALKPPQIKTLAEITPLFYYRRLRADWQHPYSLSYLTNLWGAPDSQDLTHHFIRNDLVPEFNEDNDDNEFKLREQLIGIIVHKIIQQLTLSGVKTWQESTVFQQQLYIEHLLQQHLKLLNKQSITLTRLDQPYCVKKTLHMIDTMLQDAKGQWIIREHEHGKVELALTLTQPQDAFKNNDIDVNFSCQQIIIDRTFIDDAKVRWVIDYKTAHPPAEMKLNKFLLQQKKYYQVKMQSYKEAIKVWDQTQGRLHAIRLGLYFPSFAGWIAWD